MIVVIIAGGSGSRLWPLSTPDYPKHLLKVNGEKNSLLQKTHKRAAKFASSVYVVTDESHAHHVADQLPGLGNEKIIIEPARRGTASCILAALAHLEEAQVDLDEPIAFLSADHYIRDVVGFQYSFNIAGEASSKSNKIVLVGVEPDSPATGFGYIQKDGLYDEKSYVFKVHSFKEKPDFDTAKKYVSTGEYLWNCGYFVGSLNTFKSTMQKHAPVLAKHLDNLLHTSNKQEFNQEYLKFENDTIDYALIEKVDDLLVVPAKFDWMDLGSFGDMHKAIGGDKKGNHVKGIVEIEQVENSLVHNEEDKPVAVIGLDNIVVINTKDGVLVTRKDLAKEVGVVSKRINGGS